MCRRQVGVSGSTSGHLECIRAQTISTKHTNEMASKTKETSRHTIKESTRWTASLQKNNHDVLLNNHNVSLPYLPICTFVLIYIVIISLYIYWCYHKFGYICCCHKMWLYN